MGTFTSDCLLVWLALILGVLLAVALPFERWVVVLLGVAGLLALVLLGLGSLFFSRGWKPSRRRSKSGGRI